MLGSRYRSTAPSNAPSMTDKIFEFYYLALVPDFQSRTVEDIRERGVIVTGIRDLDEALKNDWVKKYLTINQMVEFFKRGVPIRLVKDADVKDVYDTVQTHLTQWLEAIRTTLNIGDAPIEDLMWMDKFAAKLYVHAAPMFTKEALQSAIAEKLMSVQRINATNFFSKAPVAPPPDMDPIEASKKEKEARDPEQRVSLEERFKQSMTSLRRF